MLHFVGFKKNEMLKQSASRVFGLPDFYHYHYDMRAVAEFVPGDKVVFADGSENRLHREHSYNDSEVN